MEDKFHTFTHPVADIPLPGCFTNPFHYTPHPLCVIAAEETQEFLSKQEEWAEELRAGKMFGVLVVRDVAGALGYLAAFSGNLAGWSTQPFFVPPVFDFSAPECYFRQEERNISAMNDEIRRLQTAPVYFEARKKLEEATAYARQRISEAKEAYKTAKAARDLRRQSPLSESEAAALIRESQYQKAEIKRLERAMRAEVEQRQAEVDRLDVVIERMRQERKRRSAALQDWLFGQFRMLNACGEAKDLHELFADTASGVPPAGAGECAAPKLLQYAYRKRLEPLAMAEFWWGDSPVAEVRRHGYYYPACKGKCEPILRHMLRGLRLETPPAPETCAPEVGSLRILYEDAYIVAVDKPAGMLSVPGKSDADSVYHFLRRMYPDATGPLLAHRLDRDTSGILLAAKSKEAHQNLQAQFKHRSIEKKYIALLDGDILDDKGIISLPLCSDPLDRPRQIVSEEHGKPAVTEYIVLERSGGRTRVAFFPRTGRTHQLRVHAAHPLGLDCPIVGDTLYGRPAERLYLHAECIAFTHPVTRERIELRSEAPF